MTPAEFKTLRESLGLPTEWLTQRFKVSQRAIARWDDSTPPPAGVAEEMLAIEDFAESMADEVLDRLALSDGVELEYALPRVNADVANGDFPASFYRAIGARVRAGNPDVKLVWL